jgi:hypothetical protein
MDLFQNLAQKFSQTSTEQIGTAIESLTNQAIMQRRSHERRWYDNQFFDDGYHFRVISKKTGRVIDTVSRSSGYIERAIPRASRQIRSVANLLYAAHLTLFSMETNEIYLAYLLLLKLVQWI